MFSFKLSASVSGICLYPRKAVTLPLPPGSSTSTKTPNCTLPTTSPSSHSSAETWKASTAGSRGGGPTRASSSLPSRMLTTCTATLSPGLSTAPTLLTRPSLMLRTWTRPSSSAPTSTKQPKSLTPVTWPPSSCPSRKSPFFRPRCRGMKTWPDFIDSSIWPLASSFHLTRATISSPTSTCWRASSTNLSSFISFLCSNASLSVPMSMKAPKGLTVRTRPVTSCPIMKSATTFRPRPFMVSPRKPGAALRTRTLTCWPLSTSSPGWCT
mmetsp:Transcript_124273/g.362837  ORF Transcript_124273/g.362837 Transcript_124273/m.362837 type:complete len:268 (-) Transcript_124273:510-1313(-)